MFTGLIKEMAEVLSLKNNSLTLKAKYKPGIGDSICINGACLTVVKVLNGAFTVELSLETQKILAMENYKSLVHIEPAMMLKDRFEGHIVQGHIDCLGIISSINKSRYSTDFIIKLKKEYLVYIIPKGSVAIDGISLTINDVYENSFRITIIPHTMENTLFKKYKIGTRVNIETDLFSRYIYNMFKPKNEQLSWDKVDAIMSSY